MLPLVGGLGCEDFMWMCRCMLGAFVLLLGFPAVWSQSGTGVEPPGLDEIIAAANSYVQASPSWTPGRGSGGAGPSLTGGRQGMYWI